MRKVSHRPSERGGIGWVRTLCYGEAVAMLERLHAVNLSRNIKGVSTRQYCWRPRNAWKSAHNRLPGISHSQARASEDLHPPWTSGCRKRVNARGRQPRVDLPEEDVTGIPEDDWDTEYGPGGHPGIRLGVADHAGL